jgi:hypothetical protein
MKTFLTIMITFIITGGLFGGGAYYLTNQQAINNQKKLNDQISILNTQSRSLQAKIDTISQQNNSDQIKFNLLLNSIDNNINSPNLAFYMNTAENYLLQYDSSNYGVYNCSASDICLRDSTQAKAKANDQNIFIQPTQGIQNDGYQTITIQMVKDSTYLTKDYAISFLRKMTGTDSSLFDPPTVFSLGNLHGIKVPGMIGSSEDFYLVSHNGNIYIFETGIGDASTQAWYQNTLATVLFTN